MGCYRSLGNHALFSSQSREILNYPCKTNPARASLAGIPWPILPKATNVYPIVACSAMACTCSPVLSNGPSRCCARDCPPHAERALSSAPGSAPCAGPYRPCIAPCAARRRTPRPSSGVSMSSSSRSPSRRLNKRSGSARRCTGRQASTRRQRNRAVVPRHRACWRNWIASCRWSPRSFTKPVRAW